MTIQLEISPELETSLAAEARLLGMDLIRYAQKILGERRPVVASRPRPLSVEEVRALSQRFSAGSDNLPVLPQEVNNRESYYEDRW
jgi:hypothetical protein